jgi:hypothetical protein
MSPGLSRSARAISDRQKLPNCVGRDASNPVQRVAFASSSPTLGAPLLARMRLTLSNFREPPERIGWPTLVGLGLVVAGFMTLSLAVTAIGTARFMQSLGYDVRIGVAVGGDL